MWSLYGVVLIGAVSYGRPVGSQHAVHANTSTSTYLVSERPFQGSSMAIGIASMVEEKGALTRDEFRTVLRRYQMRPFLKYIK